MHAAHQLRALDRWHHLQLRDGRHFPTRVCFLARECVGGGHRQTKTPREDGDRSSSREELVRTSSRTGYLDYGANAKRYNWLAKEVAKNKGWKITVIKQKEHSGYSDLVRRRWASRGARARNTTSEHHNAGTPRREHL